MKDFWITNSRFKYIGLILFLMFVIFMAFFYLKAEEITNDPCSVCAKRMGSEVSCYISVGSSSATRIYYPNGTINTENKEEVRSIPLSLLNFTEYKSDA